MQCIACCCQVFCVSTCSRQLAAAIAHKIESLASYFQIRTSFLLSGVCVWVKNTVPKHSQKVAQTRKSIARDDAAKDKQSN